LKGFSIAQVYVEDANHEYCDASKRTPIVLRSSNSHRSRKSTKIAAWKMVKIPPCSYHFEGEFHLNHQCASKD